MYFTCKMRENNYFYVIMSITPAGIFVHNLFANALLLVHTSAGKLWYDRHNR